MHSLGHACTHIHAQTDGQVENTMPVVAHGMGTEGIIRPHRRRVQVVQSYSPGGANVHPHLKHVPWAHSSLHPKRHLDQFIRICRDHHCAQQTDTQTTKCATSTATGHFYVVHAMRPNNNNYYHNNINCYLLNTNRKMHANFSMDQLTSVWFNAIFLQQ